MNTGNTIDLSKNEFPFEHPVTISGIRGLAQKELFSRYNFSSRLQNVIAEHNDVPADKVFLFNGAEQALKNIFLMLNNGTNRQQLALPALGWDYYTVLAKQYETPFSYYKYSDQGDRFAIDRDSVLASIRKGSSALLLGSPNNPLGPSVAHNDQTLFSRHLPANGLAIVDETYRGFNDDTISTRQKISDMPNAIIVRSFSKFYGLAGIRVGYAVCGDKAQPFMESCRDYLGFNVISERIGEACIEQHGKFVGFAETTKKERDHLIEFFGKVPHCRPFKSEANFVLVEFPARDEAYNYAAHLSAHGIKIKTYPEDSGLNQCVRISIGTPDQMEYLRQVSTPFLANLSPESASRDRLVGEQRLRHAAPK